MPEHPVTPSWRVSLNQRQYARTLRRNSTGVSVGPYIVDLACHVSVIELDGRQQFESEQERRDPSRDAFLAGKGVRVLRFNNHDLMSNGEEFWK